MMLSNGCLEMWRTLGRLDALAHEDARPPTPKDIPYEGLRVELTKAYRAGYDDPYRTQD